MRFLIFLTGIFLATLASANKPILTVYAPDYFVSEWGPGPSIEEAFEKTCECDVKFSAGDLVPRLILEGSSTEADIIIGLNTDVTKKARETGLFAPHQQNNDALFLPFLRVLRYFGMTSPLRISSILSPAARSKMLTYDAL